MAGSGGASIFNVVAAADTLRQKGIRRVGAYMVPRTMSSTISACLCTSFGIRGVNYSISSACATSAHCIGNGMELIQLGKQDIVFAGGGEELHWTLSLLFDALGGRCRRSTTKPIRRAPRAPTMPTVTVLSSPAAAACWCWKNWNTRGARGARIHAELVGYGATSDGVDMVQPSGEGAVRCMRQALANVSGEVDYINTHGTSTPIGDVKELEAIRDVFGARIPPFSSTKSLTGHALGAAGVHEAIYSLLMLQNDFICASAHIERLEPAAEGMPVVRQRRDGVRLNTVLSNSFGFGGTNASLVFQRYPA